MISSLFVFVLAKEKNVEQPLEIFYSFVKELGEVHRRQVKDTHPDSEKRTLLGRNEIILSIVVKITTHRK